jgi:transcriptional regulator PpsR
MNKHHAPIQPRGFAAPDDLPGALPASMAATLLASVGDVAFILDADGRILDAAISSADLAHNGFADWVGRDWADTMTIESRPKAAEMLADAAGGERARWRQVNHLAGPGDNIPIRYLIAGLGDGARVAAIGRDMRSAAAMQQRLLQTQQSLERDYIRLRQAEARYRLLFDMASEPVLIVDAATRRIREANHAAQRLLRAQEGALGDRPVTTIVAPEDREALLAHLGASGATDDVAPLALGLVDGGGEARISARLFRQGRSALLLVRIVMAEAAPMPQSTDTALADVIEHMPDAFVLVDRDLAVLTANAAFVELAEMSSPERVVGTGLGAWLGRPGIDLDLIAAQLREHGSVRNVSTILRGAGGGQEEIEVSGVAAPRGDDICYGFTIRGVGRRMRGRPSTERDLPRSVEQLIELVGRMSLKDIVRESTDLIERLCIEAALAYTSDNRASAAEILGVSRQSLYSKLHRHGLGNLVPGDN